MYLGGSAEDIKRTSGPPESPLQVPANPVYTGKKNAEQNTNKVFQQRKNIYLRPCTDYFFIEQIWHFPFDQRTKFSTRYIVLEITMGASM